MGPGVRGFTLPTWLGMRRQAAIVLSKEAVTTTLLPAASGPDSNLTLTEAVEQLALYIYLSGNERVSLALTVFAVFQNPGCAQARLVGPDTAEQGHQRNGCI